MSSKPVTAIAGDGRAGLLELEEHADGHLVVGAGHGLRSGAERQQRAGRGRAARLGESPSSTGPRTQPGCSATACRNASSRSRASGESAWAGEEAETPVAVILDQVPGQRPHPRGVVHRHDVQFRRPAGRDGDHRDAPGERRTCSAASLPTSSATSSRSPCRTAQRLHLPLERLARLLKASSSEQSVPRSTHRPRGHQLVHEQRAVLLDPDLGDAVFQGGRRPTTSLRRRLRPAEPSGT